LSIYDLRAHLNPAARHQRIPANKNAQAQLTKLAGLVLERF